MKPGNIELRHIYQKAFLWGVIAPLATFVVGQKILIILTDVKIRSSWDIVRLLRSDGLILLSFALLGLFLFGFCRKSSTHSITLLSLQIAGLTWTLLDAIANQFYRVTGSIFDGYLLAFSIAKLGDTLSVISSEAAGNYFYPLIAVLFMIVAVPRIIVFMNRSHGIRAETHNYSWIHHAALLLICLMSAMLAIYPASKSEAAYLGRSNMLNIASSFNGALDIDPLVVERPSLNDIYLAPASFSKANGSTRKNLVFIILESTRAQSTTIHNPELKTTPFLASLAGKSMVAQRAYAVVPHTSKALVAILCGIEPRLTMPIWEAGPEGVPSPCIADMLEKVGYNSVFFQSATQKFEYRGGLVRNMGFNDFFPLEAMKTKGFEKANYFGAEDAVMLEPSEKWLREKGNQSFIATYLTLTPHHNYLAPRKRYGFSEFSEDPEKNRYLNTLHYVDQFVEELLDQYKQLGLYENSIFVILGDHGEAFGEHGRFQHDNVMWEEGLHVPLMIYEPSSAKHQRIAHPVNHLDLLPTVANLLGFEIKGGKVPGRLMWDKDTDRTLFAHCWYEKQCMAAIRGPIKVIDHYGKRPTEVYNVLEDPGEVENLASSMDDEVIYTSRAEMFGWKLAINNLYENSH